MTNKLKKYYNINQLEKINKFKYKIWATIYAYGPVWEKKVEIQDTVRALSEADLLVGSKQIYNQL